MLLIKNVRIVSPFYSMEESLDLYIEDVKISDIGKNLKYECKTIDGQNMLLMPGLIDLGCKLCEAGFENIDNIKTVAQSAVAGGFTSITTSPNTQPVIDTKSVVEYVTAKTNTMSKINFYPYGSVTKNCQGEEVAEIGEMISRGARAVSDGGVSIENTEILKDILLYLKMFDVNLVLHSINSQLAKNGVINGGYMATKLGLKGNHRVAEECQVSSNLIISKYVNNRVHLANITTEGSVKLIRDAKKENAKLTAGTCPHYFTLTENMVDNYNTVAKVNPPLRTDKDVKAIIEGLKDGTIDVIATGHSPAANETKNTEFDKASYGISSLETALMVSYTALVKNGILTPLELSEKMSLNPAKVLRLENKGVIEIGRDADLILVDDKNEYVVDSSSFYSKAKYSMYDGQGLYGKAVTTICAGEIL